MTPMFLEVTERLAVQSSPVPMQDRVHHQNQLTVIVQEKVLDDKVGCVFSVIVVSGIRKKYDREDAQHFISYFYVLNRPLKLDWKQQ